MADIAPILVATDLSARSDRAIDRAMQLSGQFGAPLLVCHALKPGSAGAKDPHLAETALRDALPDPGADVEIAMPVGPAPQAIAEAADLAKAQLIVTGIAHIDNPGGHILGNTAMHLVRKANKPVLVVKRRAHKPYRRILAATDFSPCSLHALKLAAAMFPDAELHLFHAWHAAPGGWSQTEDLARRTEEGARKHMAEFLRGPDMPEGLADRITTHLQRGDFGTVTLAMVERLDPDLVVFGTHGKTGFIRAMAGSSALAALEWVDCDALVAREPV
ncbi:nucleotide-binding universal stress UspA family protein [Altererythrobacter atlanticus]|uniref:Universal stress protein UspE n=1 Tax=Croceibacterium atlanticum TaxID=1267766 RepID=A0A0F7KNJ2_9SPHN|nr:universal stress protein [Croceibacterium atlanticum]AKH41139.1 universal stress protein UspE [Croceibacterium atlanticum]MBB5732655.1 nucleotide-binding universal stress UspA family protein [Croceibacterium atlanticum]